MKAGSQTKDRESNRETKRPPLLEFCKISGMNEGYTQQGRQTTNPSETKRPPLLDLYEISGVRNSHKLSRRRVVDKQSK